MTPSTGKVLDASGMLQQIFGIVVEMSETLGTVTQTQKEHGKAITEIKSQMDKDQPLKIFAKATIGAVMTVCSVLGGVISLLIEHWAGRHP